MQLLIVGATGGTGKQTVEQALKRGHSVTAFVRDPAKLGIQHPNLTVLVGNVLKPETLLPAVRRPAGPAGPFGIGRNQKSD